MSDELPTYFSGVAGAAARSTDHTVSIGAGEHGYAVHVDGVRVSPEFPIEVFTMNSGWEQYVDEDGLEKAREVVRDE